MAPNVGGLHTHTHTRKKKEERNIVYFSVDRWRRCCQHNTQVGGERRPTRSRLLSADRVRLSNLRRPRLASRRSEHRESAAGPFAALPRPCRVVLQPVVPVRPTTTTGPAVGSPSAAPCQPKEWTEPRFRHKSINARHGNPPDRHRSLAPDSDPAPSPIPVRQARRPTKEGPLPTPPRLPHPQTERGSRSGEGPEGAEGDRQEGRVSRGRLEEQPSNQRTRFSRSTAAGCHQDPSGPERERRRQDEPTSGGLPSGVGVVTFDSMTSMAEDGIGHQRPGFPVSTVGTWHRPVRESAGSLLFVFFLLFWGVFFFLFFYRV